MPRQTTGVIESVKNNILNATQGTGDAASATVEDVLSQDVGVRDDGHDRVLSSNVEASLTPSKVGPAARSVLRTDTDIGYGAAGSANWSAMRTSSTRERMPSLA